MKKVLIISFMTVLLLTACTKKEIKEEISDATKFKEEYESLNDKTTDSSKKYRKIEISEDNPMVYQSAKQVVEKINNKETFIVYFGFAKCPWCRSVLPTLLSASNDLGINTIYYVDILNIRDTLELENDKVVTKQKGTKDYYKLLELLDNVLEDYDIKDEDNNKIETNEKRIYAPNVVAILDGKAKALTTGISEKQTDAYMELTDDMKKETYEKFNKVLSIISDSEMCPLDDKESKC